MNDSFVNFVVESPKDGFRFANRYPLTKDGIEECRQDIEFIEKLLRDRFIEKEGVSEQK